MRSFLAAFLVFTGVAAAQNNCDRGCLTGILDRYLDAMVANDSKKAPVAANIKYTENSARLPLTEGLWFTASGLTDYKVVLADPQGGAAAFIGVVTEHMPPGQPPRNTILALRIKVASRKITEAEAVVVRNVNERNMANLKTPRPGLIETLAPAQRRSRADLIRISNLYFDAIEQSSGSVAPFDDNCNRLENGMRTAGPPLDGSSGGRGATQRCADGMNSGVFQVITAIKPRRVLVVDEEKGLTFGIYMFQHKGLTQITMKDGSTRPAPYFVGQPVTMPMAEVFKVVNGNIREVEAVGTQIPYGLGSGWE
ncbi:MAG TPA: hypothetical protein VHY84_16085 [Bryobacteraceae bacterium]|jgi:hypothetical protein|nr:hypothetical protein [Bryobacteraceae bacterium]